MKILKIAGKTGKSIIAIGEKISHLDKYCEAEKKVIITDKTTRKFHKGLFPDCEVIEIGEGELNKTLETVNKIYEKFLEFGLDRSSFVIGIGGGIVCDVTGFAASTYLRGLRFGFVPTTLLAQIDASVGGKNGVNFKGYKNLIGTIRQPEFVLCDFEMLKTLPKSELSNGFAELIKHAIIADAKLFDYLEANVSRALSLEKEVIEKIIYRSLQIKAKVVSKDEIEKGERRILNFGHTFGHAIEKTTGLRHGEAISIGMVAAATLSVAKKMLSEPDEKRLEQILTAFGLPTKMIGDKEALIDAIRKDKKKEHEKINFVLLEKIGKAKITEIDLLCFYSL
ncbi:MAG: 3-dehydroquinate synthase [Candidatus Micrarchaeota archaeon]